MKTNIINKLAALLTVSGLLANAPLTVTAQNLTVTSNTTVSGTHYENVTTNPALINTSTWSFTGSDVTLTGTGATNGRIGANFTGGGQLNLSDSRIDAIWYGIQLTNTSAATLTNVVINSGGTVASGHGVNMTTSATLTMIGGTITTGTTTSIGVNATGANYVSLRDTVINSFGNGVTLSNATTGTLNDVNITSRGGQGVNAGALSTVTVSGGTLHTLGNNGYGVSLSGTSVATLNNVNIITEGTNAYGLNMATSSTLTVNGGTITTGTTGARGATVTQASYLDLRDTAVRSYADGLVLSNTSVLAPYHADIVTQNGAGISVSSFSTATIIGGTITTVSGGNGVTNYATVNMRDTVIDAYAYGISGQGAATTPAVFTLDNLRVTSQTAAALRFTNYSVVTGSNLNLSGVSGLEVTNSSTVTLSDVIINATGTGGHGINTNGGATVNPTTLILTNAQVDSAGVGYRSSGNENTVTRMTDVVIRSADNGLQFQGAVTGTRSVEQEHYFENVSVESSGGAGIMVWHSGTRAEDFHGDSTHAYDLTFVSSTVSGSAAVVVNSIRSGTNAGGDLVTMEVPETLTISATNSTFLGDVNVSGSVARLDFTLTDNSTLTGASSVSGQGTLNVTLDNSNWNVTGRSRVTTLHGANGGTITIDHVQGEDLIVSGNNGVSGITGETKLNLTLSDGVKGDQEIWVVVDETDKMTGERFKLGNEVSYGMYQYELVNASDGAWLVYTGSSGTTPPVNPPVDPTDPTDPIIPPVVPPLPPNPPVISSEGDAIINTAAAVAGFWFTQLDNLHKRMGELRYNKPAGGDLINNVWVRAYGQQINASTGIYSVKGFSEIQYGVDLGTDYLWKLDAANQLYTGVFAGYGGADRDFHTSYNGSTDSGYGGLYATWLNNSGWYADVVAKGQYFRNEFSGADRGDYDSVGVGFSVEFGRQFEFKDGWFAEPSVQVSYLHLMNDNYTTTQGLSVDLADADVAQFYGGARFGRNIRLTNSGMLQPYIKAGGLGQISSGNTVRADGGKWRPNLDGARAVIGAGLVWQLNADSQLHLDYEASFGEKYDKPWGVNFGYRYQF